MPAYVLTEMTWPEAKEAFQTAVLAIVPVGAQEQHGPHLKMSCDAVLATEMARRLAERLHPHAVVTPTVNMGVSPHHLNFPGTITLHPETLIRLLRDIVRSLHRHGLRRFLFLNAHGGNQATLQVAATALATELDVAVYVAKTTASAKEALRAHIASPLYGHACEREVSEALYLAPQLVHPARLEAGAIREGTWRHLRPGGALQGFYRYEEMTENGCLGDARRASAAIGRALVEEALDNLEAALRAVLGLTERQAQA